MQLLDTALPEIKRVALDVKRDNRGFFREWFHVDLFKKLGLPTDFVQDNHSRSFPNVIRGLHFQYQPKQGKLVGVTHGRILDVAVDIRPSSPNFGKHVALELTTENNELLWIPPGFAHGFCVLGSAPADVVYKLSGAYNQQGEGGICYNDADIGIDWPVKNPILSDRDQHLPSLNEMKPQLAHWFA